MSRNEMVLRFQVALNIEKRGLLGNTTLEFKKKSIFFLAQTIL